MTDSSVQSRSSSVERQTMDVDIVCVGFGPAMGGFLTTLSRNLVREDGTPIVESRTLPGMPPQVICYERADDIAFGVSGVVTPGRAPTSTEKCRAGRLTTIALEVPVIDGAARSVAVIVWLPPVLRFAVKLPRPLLT